MFRRFLIVGAVLCVCAPLVFADAPRTGLVTGTVVDQGGAALPGATVQLQGERGSVTEVSDEEGAFKFFFVIPDVYVVRVDLEGFQPAEGEIVGDGRRPRRGGLADAGGDRRGDRGHRRDPDGQQVRRHGRRLPWARTSST